MAKYTLLGWFVISDKQIWWNAVLETDDTYQHFNGPSSGHPGGYFINVDDTHNVQAVELMNNGQYEAAVQCDCQRALLELNSRPSPMQNDSWPPVILPKDKYPKLQVLKHYGVYDANGIIEQPTNTNAISASGTTDVCDVLAM